MQDKLLKKYANKSFLDLVSEIEDLKQCLSPIVRCEKDTEIARAALDSMKRIKCFGEYRRFNGICEALESSQKLILKLGIEKE